MDDRITREVRLGLSRLVQGANGSWVLEYGPMSLSLAWPPRFEPCGGSGRWWWGFGKSSGA